MAGGENTNFQLINSVESHDCELSAVKFSRKGELLASCGWKSQMKLWTIDNNRFSLRAVLIGHNEGVSDVAFSSDDSQLASASDDQDIKIWDLTTEQCIRTLSGHRKNVFCLAFEEDYILSGSYDNSAKLWDRRINFPIRHIRYHSDYITSVDIDSSNRILTSSLDHMCALHDLRTLRVLKFFVSSYEIAHAKFAGSSRHATISTFDSSIKLWDTRRMKVVRKFEGHENLKYSIFTHISHTNKYLASGSENNGIFIWDFRSREILQVLEDHQGAVLSVNFHPRNENVLVSGSLDMTMKLYRNINDD